MSISQGDAVPDVTVQMMSDGRPGPVSLRELTAGKKVVLFAVPGAFTPTCSLQHLPGFVTKADEIKAKGVDEIICTAVNDAFVMDAWGKSASADAISMVADGNGDLASALGLEMDGSGFGLGTRSQRYAMVIDDGVITKLSVEAPGQFEVSSAEAILAEL
ncbi:MAG: peroxiredoxin [Gammaproteobacteria bacterium]|nr:peroxiredoxin [Gammaproteobacteria bacterium]